MSESRCQRDTSCALRLTLAHSFITSHLISSHLISSIPSPLLLSSPIPHLTAPHLTSPHLTLSPFIYISSASHLISSSSLSDSAIQKMLASLDDPFTRFFEPDRFKTLKVCVGCVFVWAGRQAGRQADGRTDFHCFSAHCCSLGLCAGLILSLMPCARMKV